ncbi:MAG TPA: hypothetical protein VGO80_22665 [Solirubrobacteraceae bacterium]|jgi:hypothetical protein|nr:hypothetical protein [Solirubrobacteraceae bacterium]
MRHAPALLLTLAAALVAAPAASAATLATDAPCYQETQDVVLSGTAFAPMTPVAISQDAAPFGTADTDAAGAFQRKFAAPELGRSVREQVFTLSGTDSALNTAETTYRTTKIFADFTPDAGDPKTLQVRFSVNGFGLLRNRASVYLHYVSPSGKVRRNVRLGKAVGTCGKIRATRLRHLFPFRAERGRWVLQFDTNKTYKRATSKSKYIWVRKPVEIFNR